MTDEERAEYYDQRRDDPRVWEDIDDAYHVPTRAAKKGLSTTVTVRFAPDDAAKLRALAERLDLSYSDVIREAVRQVVSPRFVVDYPPGNVTYHATSIDTIGRTDRVRNPLGGSASQTGGVPGDQLHIHGRPEDADQTG